MTQKDYYDYREDENIRQVSLKKLLQCAFKKWALILLAGILLGGLFGAYKIVTIRAKKDTMIKEYEEYQAKLEAYNTYVADYQKSIADYQADLTSKLTYINNSVRMKVDCFNCPTSFSDILVTTEDGSALSAADFSSIVNAIFGEVFYGNSMEEVAEKTGLNSSYLRELTTVKQATTGTTLRIAVRGENEEQAEAARRALIDILLNEKMSSFSALGDFVAEEFNEGTATMFDADIQSFQTTQQNALNKTQTNLYTAQSQLSQLSKPSKVDQYSKKYMLKNGIKMGIVGFAGGVVLMIIALCIWVLRKNIILSADEIDGEFGIKTLADLSEGKSDDAAEIDFIMARLENCIAGKDNAVIGVVGSVPSGMLESLAEKLNEKAREAGDAVKFECFPEFNKNAQMYKKLKGLDGVILTEEIGKSDYTNIRREIALIAENGSELLGTVYY